MEKLKSEGKCVFCDKMYSSTGIGRHLTSHLKAKEKEATSDSKAFHVKISAAEKFLHILIDGEMTLADLDEYLRSIWLECCGHLSSFMVRGREYDFGWDPTDEFGEPKGSEVETIFRKGMKLKYDYDFGSTTRLEIQVVNEYNIAFLGGILLLSRNEPLPILCHICEKKPAIKICSIHIYDGESMFCKDCTKIHAKKCPDFDDYASMTVFNSPRMGVCAYEGGLLDTERDGIWKGN